MHGGAAPQVLRKAQERIVMAQDDAASLLVRWMNDDTVPYAVRVKAAEGLLNRGGNAPGQRLEVSLDPAPWQELIDGIVSEVGDQYTRPPGPLDGDVLDAEVVPDLAPAALDPAPSPTPPGTEDVRIPSRRQGGRRVAGQR
jgi:hypothetical protein